jgi:hypothetical protein
MSLFLSHRIHHLDTASKDAIIAVCGDEIVCWAANHSEPALVRGRFDWIEGKGHDRGLALTSALELVASLLQTGKTIF